MNGKPRKITDFGVHIATLLQRAETHCSDWFFMEWLEIDTHRSWRECCLNGPLAAHRRDSELERMHGQLQQLVRDMYSRWRDSQDLVTLELQKSGARLKDIMEEDSDVEEDREGEQGSEGEKGGDEEDEEMWRPDSSLPDSLPRRRIQPQRRAKMYSKVKDQRAKDRAAELEKAITYSAEEVAQLEDRELRNKSAAEKLERDMAIAAVAAVKAQEAGQTAPVLALGIDLVKHPIFDPPGAPPRMEHTKVMLYCILYQISCIYQISCAY